MASRSSRNLSNNNILFYRRRRSGGAGSDAFELLANETQGLALDFTDDFFFASEGFYGSANIKDTTTPANNYDSSPTKAASSLLTYTSPSVKMCMGPSGTLRYQAHNLIRQSENIASTTGGAWNGSGAAWTATAAAATTPDGLPAASIVLGAGKTKSAANPYASQDFAGISGAGYNFSFDIKSVGFTQWTVQDGSSEGGILNFSTGIVTGLSTGSGTMTPLGDDWWRVSISFRAGSAFIYLYMYPSDGGVASGTETIFCTKVHIRRTPSDSTYLSTTTAARYALPIEFSSGSPIGLLVEEARTNLALYASDFTNAAWTKSNMTTAKTATGPDGVANSATTLTATAGNATALQAITSGSAARITSVYLKRRTGTGNIDVTQDNGSTWATQSITSDWERYSIAPVTSTNPTVGIRIVTNGDAVDVALFDHEVGSSITSPIETFASTVTRAGDDISIPYANIPWSTTELTTYVHATSLAQDRHDMAGASNSAPVTIANLSGSDVTVFNGSVWGGGSITQGTPYKFAVASKSGDSAASLNGAAAIADTTAFTIGLTPFKLTYTSNIGSHLYHQMLVLPVRKPNADLVTLTT